MLKSIDFELFLNNFPQPVIITDINLNILFYNNKLVQYIELNFVFDEMSKILSIKNLEILYENIQNNTSQFILELEKSDYNNSFLITFYKDKDSYIFIFEDIQRKVELEKKLELFETHIESWLENEISLRIENQKKYEFLFNSINDILLIGEFCTNRVFKNFKEVNQKAINLLKYSKDEFNLLNPLSIFSKNFEFEIKSIINSIIKNKEYIFETEVISKDGEIIHVEINSSLFIFNNKQWLLFSIRDLRERIELENQKKEQEQILIHQSKLASMGEMIANIAHQWRQPLNSLSLITFTLKKAYEKNKLDSNMIDKYYNNSNQLIQQMSKTIDDFKSFFDPKEKKYIFSIKSVILNAMTIIDASIKYANIDIEIYCLEDLKYFGDENKLQQVILNILTNAKDAIKDSNHELKKIYISCKKESNTIMIVIEDTGDGIKNIDKLFEQYYTTKNEKGTGIGLYMSKIIITKHFQGNIYAVNGKLGAIFTIELPLLNF